MVASHAGSRWLVSGRTTTGGWSKQHSLNDERSWLTSSGCTYLCCTLTYCGRASAGTRLSVVMLSSHALMVLTCAMSHGGILACRLWCLVVRRRVDERSWWCNDKWMNSAVIRCDLWSVVCGDDEVTSRTCFLVLDLLWWMPSRLLWLVVQQQVIERTSCDGELRTSNSRNYRYLYFALLRLEG